MTMKGLYVFGELGMIVVFLFGGVNLQEMEEDSGCGNPREVRGPDEGELLSHPAYGRSLAPLNFCEWILQPPSGRYVSLTIEDMGNISCVTQLFVYTHLGGERYPGWNLCGEGTFPLHGVPHHLASRRGTWLRILYRGNKISERTTGFSAKYSFQEPGCSGGQRLSGPPWWFASHPGAGSWAMEAGSVCSWTLTAPYGQYVALKRGPIDLHCVSNWQSLAVHDGQTVSNSSLIVMLTCAQEVSPLASSGRYLHLIYSDRWASNSLGFNISFEFYKSRQSGCGGDHLLSSPSGYMLSHLPAGGSTYSPLSRCQWRILAPPGTRISFQFDVFDLTRREQDNGCDRDLLVFHDGLEGTAASHIFCNTRSPPQILSSRYHVIDAYFSTETRGRDSDDGKGFIIKYNRMCFEPQPVPNSRWISPDENKDGAYKITFGESVHYACTEGFVLVRGDMVRTCTETGILSGSPPICRARECEYIPQPAFSNLELRDINMDGISKVTYREIVLYDCVTGYTAIAGDNRRHCLANGSLGGQDLKCQAAHCPVLPTVPHTTVVTFDSQQDGQEVVSFGEKVIYSCNHGYMEASGSSMRMCQADGSYSGEDLVCSARVCGEPPAVLNTKVELEDINGDGDELLSYPEHAIYSCLEGYEVLNGDSLRVCTAEGTINGTDLVCGGLVNSLSPSSGLFHPMTKPAALGTAIALCFFIVLMIVLISVIIVKMRHRKAATEKRANLNKILTSDVGAKCSVFTLPRQVTTPWNTAPQLQGRRREELIMSRGPFFFRWPMYLDDFKVDSM